MLQQFASWGEGEVQRQIATFWQVDMNSSFFLGEASLEFWRLTAPCGFKPVRNYKGVMCR